MNDITIKREIKGMPVEIKASTAQGHWQDDGMGTTKVEVSIPIDEAWHRFRNNVGFAPAREAGDVMLRDLGNDLAILLDIPVAAVVSYEDIDRVSIKPIVAAGQRNLAELETQINGLLDNLAAGTRTPQQRESQQVEQEVLKLMEKHHVTNPALVKDLADLVKREKGASQGK